MGGLDFCFEIVWEVFLVGKRARFLGGLYSVCFLRLSGYVDIHDLMRLPCELQHVNSMDQFDARVAHVYS
jgi:hypothetical protein